ncbi:MAG: hypothetical protein ACKVJX_06625 [Verrucomicrobiia bacterium]
MTTPPQESDSRSEANKANGAQLAVILSAFVCLLLGLNWFYSRPEKTDSDPSSPSAQAALIRDLDKAATKRPGLGILSEKPGAPRSAVALYVTNFWDEQIEVEYWYDGVADWLKESSLDTGNLSNIRPLDYAGPESCKECHPGNYENWRGHAHRRMNELAIPENVLGDFSGTARINFKGGVGEFYTDNGKFRMATEKEGSRRVYDVQRTIGSRFFQYYTGKLIEGPDNGEPRLRDIEHVLPFGYWIDGKEWVPAVRTFRPEDADHFPFDPYGPHRFAPYDVNCGNCHTTMPVGDWLVQQPGMGRLAEYTPHSVHFHFTAYLDEVYPGIIGDTSTLTNRPDSDIAEALEVLSGEYPTRERSVTLGISCEACHYGSAAHVANSTKEKSEQLPRFFPVSPHLFLEAQDAENAIGKSDLNKNFTCAKCHTGERTEYASGHHTFNSTEYADAVRGACYDPKKAAASSMRQLTCVHCHEPHKGIGKKWTPSPQMDDDKCLHCHQDFKPEAARVAHTHHPMGSSGARCMNCHMPKINEGMQDAVRTHRIFSPTHAGNIEANHPNACNLCHLEKSIDWTVAKLSEWYNYDANASEAGIAANYPKRDQPVGAGWLTGKHHGTRLAAAEALIHSRQTWAVPALIDQLDTDPFLVNRQLTQRGLDQWLGVELRDMGYQFYMTPPKRKETIARLRPKLLQLKRPE